MNKEKIDTYRYMDNDLKVLREQELKKFLINNETTDLSFVDLDIYEEKSSLKDLIRKK